ncbi:MAG: FadR/GntR family transcriptional regulator [Chloroflexota bacterium]
MGESPHLTPIARSMVTDEIVKRLASFIVDEGLKPGDRLPSERDLRNHFAVGRSSMREAIKTLAAVGVVEVRAGSGMFVGSGEPTDLTRALPWGLLISERSAYEIVEARRVVEVELAGLAAQRATGEELADLARCVEALRLNVGNAEDYTRENVEFHLSIARAAHNQVLGHVLRSLQTIIRVWTYQSFTPESLAEHEAIHSAICRRSADEARETMAKHLASGEGHIMAHLTLSSQATLANESVSAVLRAQTD